MAARGDLNDKAVEADYKKAYEVKIALALASDTVR